MSPLVRYYGSFLVALVLGLVAGAVTSQGVRNALVVVVLALAGYAMLVRCPNCGTPLRNQRNGMTRGLPGRACRACGCDLSK